MPDRAQIEAVREYIKHGYEAYEIVDRPGDLKHVFTLTKDNERLGEVHIMRSFWDDNPTPDKILPALIRLSVATTIVEAKGKPVFVWTNHVSIGI